MPGSGEVRVSCAQDSTVNVASQREKGMFLQRVCIISIPGHATAISIRDPDVYAEDKDTITIGRRKRKQVSDRIRRDMKPRNSKSE